MSRFFKDRTFIRDVLWIAVPMMLQQLITSSVNLVDNLMVGTLGDHAISSVAAVNRFYMISNFAVLGLVNTGAVFIAQYKGARNQEKMKESFRLILLFSALIMGFFTAIALLAPRVIMRFFTAEEAVITDGMAYIAIAAWSFLPMGVMNSVYTSMRAIGETRAPLYCSAVSILTNMFFNYCLIFGHFGFPRMGIRGAAMGTLIARGVELAMCLVFYHRGKYDFATKIRDLFTISRDLLKRLLAKAAPLMLNETLWAAGMATLFKLYSTRGPDVMSGYSISGTIADLFFTLFSGMAVASTVLISTPLGAGKLDEARRNAYQLLGFSMCMAVVFGVFIYASRSLVPLLYAGVSPQARQVARDILMIQGCLFWIYMCSTQCYFILRAGGDMRHTLILDSIFMWTVNISVVAFVAYGTKLPYLSPFIAGECTDLLKMILAWRLVRREKWVVNLAAQGTRE